MGIKGMTSDKAELQVVESFLNEHKIEAREQFWGSFAHRIDPANQQMHEDLNTKILAWGRQGIDDISEILVCLMLLFSQNEEHGSQKIKSVPKDGGLFFGNTSGIDLFHKMQKKDCLAGPSKWWSL